MKREIFWTDVDGVLTDYASGFDQFVEQRHPEIETQGSCARDLAARTMYRWLGVENSEAEKPFFKEFHDTDWYQNMPLFADAVQFVPRLQRAGYQFRALSHSREPEKTQSIKQANLDRELRGIVVQAIPYEQKKKDFLDACEPGIFVDDSLKNVREGLGRHKCLWMVRFDVEKKQIQEARDEGIIVVRNWADIYRRIDGYRDTRPAKIKVKPRYWVR
ncbi:MAG: hypothetical protein ACOY3I_04360 [Verrucomicrobiota bacterium]